MHGAVLIGPASLDRYLDGNGTLVTALPGGGALNMAYHWSRTGTDALFVTRVGEPDAELFRSFLVRHGIPHLADQIVGRGPSASIDIRTRADRQPFMDNFVEGVWAGFRLTPDERKAVGAAKHLHCVLVEPVIAELGSLGDEGVLGATDVSADFLSFVHYDVERFAGTMHHVDLAFIGWQHERDHPTLDGIREVVWAQRKLAVITHGADGVLVVDGRDGARTQHWEPVDAVEVQGTTVGCGDAFIAAFLGEWWADRGMAASLAAGKAAGAAATTWMRPLPDEAYG